MKRELSALFIDFDSYFASVEQHLQPELRGRPLGVTPVMAESSCCIASSYEAKAFNVKTGTQVAEARTLCPGITIIPARPEEYVRFHHILLEQIEECIHIEETLSIDEVWCWLPYNWREPSFVESLGEKIQQRLAANVSPTITCSVGAGPNTWLAKMASKMNKPNGIFIIQQEDLPDCLYRLKLRDIHGVGRQMELRLHAHGIHSVYDLCNADMRDLRTAWGSIEGELIWRQLRGEQVQRKATQRQSYSHSHVLPPNMRPPDLALGVLHKLTQKAGLRMRSEGYLSASMSVQARQVNKQAWQRELNFEPSDDLLFFSKLVSRIWKQRPQPQEAILQLAVTFKKLRTADNFTPSLFHQETSNHRKLNKAIEEVIKKYGSHSIYLGGASSAMSQEVAPTRISFGNVPELEE